MRNVCTCKTQQDQIGGMGAWHHICIGILPPAFRMKTLSNPLQQTHDLACMNTNRVRRKNASKQAALGFGPDQVDVSSSSFSLRSAPARFVYAPHCCIFRGGKIRVVVGGF